MENQLPDLDENVSFVVDAGAPVGPMAMREIIDSIRAGARAPDVLVWWAGASDWLSFSSDQRLIDLLSGLPATNQPPPPEDVEGDLTTLIDELESRSDEDGAPDEPATPDDGALDDSPEGERFPEPEVTSFGVDASGPEAGALATVAVSYIRDEPAGEAEEEPAEPVAEVAEQAEVEEAETDLVEATAEDVGDVEADDAPDDAVEHDAADHEATDAVVFELADDDPSDLDEADSDPEPEAEPVAEQQADAEPDADAEPEVADAPIFDPAAEAEADELLARGPRAMHPSAGWSVDDDGEPIDAATADVDAVVEQPVLSVVGGLDVIDDPVAEVDHGSDEAPPEEDVVDDVAAEADHDEVSEPDDHASEEVAEHDDPAPEEPTSDLPDADDDRPQGLTGLFSSPLREEAPSPEAAPVEGEDSDTPQATLEKVGARIDALTSATRRARQPEDEAASEPDLVPAAGSWQAVENGPDLDERFADMVQRSVAHQRRMDWALRVDELLLSASITAIVDKGYVLLDLEAHESSQRAIFDHHDDSRHIRLELEPLSPINAAGDPVGRHVKATMAWGRDVADADAAFATVRAQATDDDPMPGTIRSEVNMVSSSASTVVDLIWAANDFVQEDHSVDRVSLDASIAAMLRALESRWYEWFAARD